MKQSNKCGRVRMMKYSTYTWDLVRAIQSAFPASCKTPATLINSICPYNSPEKRKEPRNEIQLPANPIVLPWPTYTDPRAKRGGCGTQP